MWVNRQPARSLARLGAVITAVTVIGGSLGAYAARPLADRGWLAPVYITLVLAAVVCAFTTPLRRWSAVPPWAFLAPAACLLAWMPYAVQVAPNAAAATREIDQLTLAIFTACVAFAGTRGAPTGALGVRAGWAGALALSCAFGLWEIAEKTYLFRQPLAPWTERRIPVGTFVNPNNLSTAMIAMLAGTLALRAQTTNAIARYAIDAVVAVGSIVIIFTQSRTGVGALIILMALEVWRRTTRHPDASPPAPRSPRRRYLHAGAGVGVAGLVMASFVIPSLARINPLSELWSASWNGHTASSDRGRLRLLQASLRYLQESGYLGSGAGSFEPLLKADPHSGFKATTNLHNAFFEILSQYGVVVAAVMVAALGVLIRVCLAGRLGRRAPRLDRDVRVEMAGYLLSFVAFACTASSSLTYQTWWTILASACAVWWAALPARRPAPGAQETGGPPSVVDRPHVAGSGVGASAARPPVVDQALHRLQ